MKERVSKRKHIKNLKYNTIKRPEPVSKSSSTSYNDELRISGKNAILSYLTLFEGEQKSQDHRRTRLDILEQDRKGFDEKIKKIKALTQELGIPVKSHALNSWPFDLEEKNKGLSLSIPCPKVFDFDEVKEELKALEGLKRNDCSCQLVVLDHIHDPRNFGAILRTCAFFGVKYVIFPKDRQAQISSTVVQASEGGIFEVKLISTVNLSRTLSSLKDFGFWIIGAHARSGSQDLNSIPKDRAYTLVLGNEAKGVGREILKNCDYSVRISGNSQSLDSLNVSVSSGVFFYYLTIN